MKKLEPVASMIPNLVVRMHALQGLHSEAAHFSEKLDVFGEEQDVILEMGRETEMGVERLLKALGENQKVVALNIAGLESRMGGLRTGSR